ncbi:hypothetical protein LUZ60_001135 [Juncus effusus]|nr:hypothetical protein LUZ60_001135 [Juncus effusus]
MVITAITCGCTGFVTPKGYNSKSLPNSRASMANRSHVQVLRSSPVSIAKPLVVRSKVYEDTIRGIVCYTDEKGELICEGYDEGPRFVQESIEISNTKRQTECELLGFLQTGNAVISPQMDLFLLVQEQNKCFM